MGSFDEGKSASSSMTSAASEAKLSESKHADAHDAHRRSPSSRRSRTRCRQHEAKSGEAKYSEAKVDNGSIFVDDLESKSDDQSDERSEELFSDSSFDSDEDLEEDATDEEGHGPPAARVGRTQSTSAVAESDVEDSADDGTEDDEEEEEEDDDDDEEDDETDSSLSSDEFVDEDFSHLEKYVGMDVVVCFGEAWLRGTVARYQPNDGRHPTKVCGILIKYDKAESEWLRDIEGDPDVQVFEPHVSWGQKFNATEIGDPVIGLYNSDSSIWCPGVVIKKIPAPQGVDGREGTEAPRFIVRFENGQSGQCTCDTLVPFVPTVAQIDEQQKAAPPKHASPSSSQGKQGGGKKSGQKSAGSPSSWSFVDGDVSTSDDTEGTSSSSDDEEEFVGHRSRSLVHTPQHKRRPSPQSIEFSWQQEGQCSLHPRDGPPKDCDSAIFPRRPSGSSLHTLHRTRSGSSNHSGSGRNLLQQAVGSGSRENLLHDPQKLLDLPLEELVEGGFARQVLSDVTRSPRMDLKRIDHWSHCKCRYEDVAKTKFYLYEERTGEVLLSAKRIGDNFYISQYAEFPDLVTAKNLQQHAQKTCGVLHFCASSKPKGAKLALQKRFRRGRRGNRLARCQLWSTSCDYCDNALAKYVCGPPETDGDGFFDALAPAKSKSKPYQTTAEQELQGLKRMGCRQLLADFTQSNVEIRMGPSSASPGVPAVEARRLTVALPTLETDPRTERTHHCGWCDRRPRDQESTLQLVSAVPEWNDEAQRLTMCFEEAHVREHSSKNFLVHEVPDPVASSDGGPKSLRDLASPNSRKSKRKQIIQSYESEMRPCLQFGKSSKQLFTLSYRYPMSPMQGFGIALSHFNWMPDS